MVGDPWQTENGMYPDRCDMEYSASCLRWCHKHRCERTNFSVRGGRIVGLKERKSNQEGN